ncbi:hypothetical protein [Robinsoniella peoriensis]
MKNSSNTLLSSKKILKKVSLWPALHSHSRGDKARQTKDGHSGLGLYITRQLVELLGGAIKV